jgi:hypothetical protein
MYKFAKYTLGIMLMTMLTNAAAIEVADWHLKRDRNDIKVFVGSTSDTDYKSFKAVSVLKTDIRALVNLMRDMSVMDQWLETCRDPQIIDEPNEASRIIHMRNDFPYLILADRDLVLLQRFRRISEKIIMVDLIDRGGQIEEVDGQVRAEFNGHWKFTQLEDDEVEVEYLGVMDPKGNIAPWMANMSVLDVPYKTLRKIRKTLHNKKTKYDRPMSISSL